MPDTTAAGNHMHNVQEQIMPDLMNKARDLAMDN